MGHERVLSIEKRLSVFSKLQTCHIVEPRFLTSYSPTVDPLKILLTTNSYGSNPCFIVTANVHEVSCSGERIILILIQTDSKNLVGNQV
jgi:hypothetical protein